MGQCPGCKAWNTFVEEKVVTGARKTAGKAAVLNSAPASILEVTTGEETRIGTGMSEFDRVLGGGIVKDPCCCWAAIRESVNQPSCCRYAVI